HREVSQTGLSATTRRAPNVPVSGFLRGSRICLDNADAARLRSSDNPRQFSSQPGSFREQGGGFQADRDPLAVHFVQERGRYELALPYLFQGVKVHDPVNARMHALERVLGNL